MSANQAQWGLDPLTGMSAHDALLLAVRNCVWLITLPLAVTLIVYVIYTHGPARASATAVLNADLDLLQLYVAPIVEDLPDSTSVSMMANNDTVIISVEAADPDEALATVDRIVDRAPQPDRPHTSLNQAQGLELRAMRRYQQHMQDVLKQPGRTLAEIYTLTAEITATANRVAYLEQRDVPANPKPKVLREAEAEEMRHPPSRNIVVFTFLATMFVTWGSIYGTERRRIIQEKGNASTSPPSPVDVSPHSAKGMLPRDSVSDMA